MRRLLLPILLVSALALVPAAGAQPAAAKRLVQFKVMSYTRITIPHDVAPKGKENRGDYIKYKSLLVTLGPLFGKKKKNVPVGWDQGTLTYLSATKARLLGKATVPGQGTIRYKGPMVELKNGNSRVRIVGGTGKFRGAKGYVIIGPGSLKALNIFRFTVPGALVA